MIPDISHAKQERGAEGEWTKDVFLGTRGARGKKYLRGCFSKIERARSPGQTSTTRGHPSKQCSSSLPQRLGGIEAAPVGLDVDDAAGRTCHGRAHRGWRAEANGAPREGEVREPRAPDALVPVRPAAGERLVDDHRALRTRDSFRWTMEATKCVEKNVDVFY